MAKKEIMAAYDKMDKMAKRLRTLRSALRTDLIDDVENELHKRQTDKNPTGFVELSYGNVVDLYSDNEYDFEPQSIAIPTSIVMGIFLHSEHGITLVTSRDSVDTDDIDIADLENCEWTIEHLRTNDIYWLWNDLVNKANRD